MSQATARAVRKRAPSTRPAGHPRELKGSEVPTIFTPPKRPLTCKTSHGFECIQFAETVLGIQLYPWQKWMLKHALELNPDGRYRFRTVVLLVGRQNGKSTLLQVWALWRMYVDRSPLVIGTAQNLDLAEEQWQAAVDLAEENEELAAEIIDVKKTNGKYTLKLENTDKDGVKRNQRYKVAAASRKGGRGLSGDLVIMDELREHSNWESWGAVTKTTMARPRPQVLCASNAGDASSVVLRHLRKQALAAIESGELDDVALGLFEWSAMYWKEGSADQPGEWANLPTGDRKGWAMANPSMNHGDPSNPEAGGITTAALEAAYTTDPDPIFRTECLCQWVNTAKGGAFEDGVWAKLQDVNSEPVGRYVFGLALSWDRNGTISMAGRRGDGLVHGEVVTAREGVDWIIDWFLAPDDAGLFARRIDDPDLIGVAIQANGAPESALVASLVEAGVPVIEWAGGELGRGTGQFYDTVRGGGLKHRGQPILDVAVSMAATRPVADYWLWDRKKSLVDIASLIALTAAVWALNRPETEEAETAYSDPGLMFV